MRRVLLLPVAALAVIVGGCGRDASDGDRVVVAAAFYPLEQIVRSVGGDAIEVVALVPPGEEAHEYEPTAQQLTALQDADVVVYLGNEFQPSVQKAIDSLPSAVRRVDLLQGLTVLPISEQLPGTEGTPAGESLGDGNDPHVWLDPANMRAMTTSVVDALSTAAPSLASTFRTNGSAFDTALGTLDSEFRDGLASCTSDILVTTHRAFGYLAAAYGLTQVAIAGISPSDEPSAKSLETVAAFAAEHHVGTIFFEENLPPDLATTVAEEIGATTAVLDPVESLSSDQLDAGEDYLSVMRANLATLRDALGCS
jgi:zinc transport system substrate-binding protein